MTGADRHNGCGSQAIRPRRTWLFALGLLIAILSTAVAQAQSPGRRVALVVANGQYEYANRLVNPIHDAQLMAASLRRAGFTQVVVQQDLGLEAFRRALRSFQNEADGAEVALVYYAGHGIEGAGKNWLVPTDATLANERALAYEAVNLDMVMDAVSGAHLRVVVLDACRDNPFGRSWRGSGRGVTRGLADIQVDDVLVLYSAAPGQLASDGDGVNSPFAMALARRLPQRDLAIQLLPGLVRDDVLAATGGGQRPYYTGSITGTPFMLVAGGGAPIVGPAPAPAPDARTIELEFWKTVEASNDPSLYAAYLQQYPNGAFASLARSKLASQRNKPSDGGDERPRPEPGVPGGVVSGWLAYEITRCEPAGEMTVRCDGAFTNQSSAERYIWTFARQSGGLRRTEFDRYGVISTTDDQGGEGAAVQVSVANIRSPATGQLQFRLTPGVRTPVTFTFKGVGPTARRFAVIRIPLLLDGQSPGEARLTNVPIGQ